jgi:pyridoxal phosphate enzyme (YggS family)
VTIRLKHLMSSITENLEAIRHRIHEAAVRTGRAAESVELLAVSKTHPVETIQQAVEAGQLMFGENRVQEILLKQPQLPGKLQWHLIGPLQSNKVRKILPCVEMIHAVDSLDIARDINRIAGELGLHPRVFIEINLATESTKHGFNVYALDRLYIQGVMCIPPFDPVPEKTRPYFAKLRELRDDLEKLGGAPLPQLSMGMSHDFETAIEEGSTIVRVGSAIFGSRA